MSNAYGKRRYVVASLIALMACVLLFLFDWTRHRSADVFIDIVLVVVMTVAVLKSLIDSTSESESQRRFPDQLNHR
jgi:hypothetical protein